MSKKPSEDVTRRRRERANVADRLQGVFVKCDALIPKRELRVFNISELGLGVEAKPVRQAPGHGDVLEAKLLVGSTVAPVKLRLVHMSPEVMGMEFVEPSLLLQGAIQRYFEAELAGASLRLNESSSTKKRIYESKDGHRLEILIGSPGVMDKFSIRVLGNSVVWENQQGLKLLQNNRSEPVPEFLLKQLIKLAKSADNVESGLRNQLEAVLSGTYEIKTR